MMVQVFVAKASFAPAMLSPPEKWRGSAPRSVASVSSFQKPSCPCRIYNVAALSCLLFMSLCRSPSCCARSAASPCLVDERTTGRLEEQGLPYREWMLDEGTVSFGDAPPEGVFYNRMRASSHTHGHRYSPELTLATLHWLERNGRRVLDDHRALHLEVRKLAQYRVLIWTKGIFKQP